MKNLLRGLALALVVSAFAPSAHAQYMAGNLNAYEAQSHARWVATHNAFYGPMGPARAELHEARVTVDRSVHQFKQMIGNPDLQYYSRFDRRPVGLLGPTPAVGMPMGGMAAPVIQPAPVMGGAAMNQTGGARYPTRFNPSSRLFW
jgi:hypothetical protein